jgi:hypothetical protein
MSDEQELLDTIEQEEKEAVDITDIRKKAVELRDEYLHKLELTDQLTKVNQKITNIERNDLPEMFSRAGISRLDVEPVGNHPAFVAERETVYTAKIPEEKRMDAFQWFESTGHGDLVKSVINIIFGMQEHEKRLAVMKLLSDHGVEFFNNESVHHSTLKAFVKREVRAGRIVPMDLLGVYIFDEVKIK